METNPGVSLGTLTEGDEILFFPWFDFHSCDGAVHDFNSFVGW